MQINIIRARYRNLKEFKGSNFNDRNKLMWNTKNISKISLFAKGITSRNKRVIPLDENGNELKIIRFNSDCENIEENIIEEIENYK